MNKKVTYKIQNWSKYNQSLINRGNITLWFSEDTIDGWFALPSGKSGRPNYYSDQCIELALTIRALYNLPLRTTQGFLMGLLELLGVALPVPHYSRLSRRAKMLKINYKISNKNKNINIVIDSTGLKIYGEGEWKVRVHGKDKRRTWRKLHLAINPDNFQIESLKLTKSNVTDGTVLPELVSTIGKINNAYADAAYMYKECFDAIDTHGGTALIDLRGGTSLAKKPSPGLVQRNRIVEEIWNCGNCKKTWKKQSGYHKRSLVETQMFRFKQILGAKLSSRKFENQVIEAKIKSLILNQMTALGMPKTIKVEK